MNPLRCAFLLLLLGLLLPVAATGQARTEGLFLSATLNGTGISYDEENIDAQDNGAGLDLRIGYGFSRLFTLYAGATAARMSGGDNEAIEDDYNLGIGELTGRFHLGRRGSSFVPYLEVALQGVTISYEEDFELSFEGSALGLGGGLMIFLSDGLALDLGLRGSAGAFQEVKYEGIGVDLDEDDFEFGIGRISLGLSWFPFR